ncbi:MAG TPA: ATP-dependent helicase, partial [Candidatus Omnitrophota bacterium]|nr:ATP-dependent helicase [Candidatus Omnitrophota bacterium]
KVFADAKVITLEENYRSSQPILNLTNEIIRQAREKFEKKLFSRRQGQGHPLYVETADEHEQSEFVAERILELREEGVSLREMAVLFRSGWHSNDLEIELSKRNIPFRKYGGQRFVEASHIKDILSYLKVAYNASDQVSWHRLLLLLPKIGPKTAEKILEEVIILKRGLSVDLQGLVFQKNPQLAGLFQFLTKALSAGLGVGEMFHLFLGHYQPLLKEKYDDFHKRGNDLDSLYRIAIRYKSLEQFLTDMALEPPEKSLAQRGPEDKEEDFVTLSTIHSAKGLEWKSVFIIHLAEGHLPSYLSLEDEDQIEEERRLFYVASTRAKDNLFLIKPRLNTSIGRYFDEGRSYFNQTSRFLDEGRILDKFVSTEVI